MRSGWKCLLVLLCACKAEIGGGNPADPDARPIDGPADASVDAVGTFGPWSAPALIPGANTAIGDDDGTLSNSKLELVFAKADPAVDAGRKHLYYAVRPSATSMAWSTPVRLSFNIDGTSDETPRFSADDKTLYFGSNRVGTTGALDIWQVSHSTPGVATGFGTPALVPAINSTATDKWCVPCNGNHYMMTSGRAPSTTDDIWEGTLGQAPTLVTELSSTTTADNGVLLAKDCLTVYFTSARSGVARIYKSTRSAIGSPWNPPVIVDDFLMTVGGAQSDPWISDDGKTFIFASDASGSLDMYITTR
jgi:hypothetical protein